MINLRAHDSESGKTILIQIVDLTCLMQAKPDDDVVGFDQLGQPMWVLKKNLNQIEILCLRDHSK